MNAFAARVTIRSRFPPALRTIAGAEEFHEVATSTVLDQSDLLSDSLTEHGGAST